MKSLIFAALTFIGISSAQAMTHEEIHQKRDAELRTVDLLVGLQIKCTRLEEKCDDSYINSINTEARQHQETLEDLEKQDAQFHENYLAEAYQKIKERIKRAIDLLAKRKQVEITRNNQSVYQPSPSLVNRPVAK